MFRGTLIAGGFLVSAIGAAIGTASAIVTGPGDNRGILMGAILFGAGVVVTVSAALAHGE